MPAVRDDPLKVYGRRLCPDCQCHRRKRRRCQRCAGAGFERADLANHWAPRPGFLVGGGPSLKDIDTSLLAQRGVVALGINNVAAAVPVTAHVFGDPQVKFHHGLFLDPDMMTFCPVGKMPYGVRAKLPDGTCRGLETLVEMYRRGARRFGISLGHERVILDEARALPGEAVEFDCEG